MLIIDLPNDILKIILLGYMRRLSYLGQVCKRFRAIIKSKPCLIYPAPSVHHSISYITPDIFNLFAVDAEFACNIADKQYQYICAKIYKSIYEFDNLRSFEGVNPKFIHYVDTYDYSIYMSKFIKIYEIFIIGIVLNDIKLLNHANMLHKKHKTIKSSKSLIIKKIKHDVATSGSTGAKIAKISLCNKMEKFLQILDYKLSREMNYNFAIQMGRVGTIYTYKHFNKIVRNDIFLDNFEYIGDFLINTVLYALIYFRYSLVKYFESENIIDQTTLKFFIKTFHTDTHKKINTNIFSRHTGPFYHLTGDTLHIPTSDLCNNEIDTANTYYMLGIILDSQQISFIGIEYLECFYAYICDTFDILEKKNIYVITALEKAIEKYDKIKTFIKMMYGKTGDKRLLHYIQ